VEQQLQADRLLRVIQLLLHQLHQREAVTHSTAGQPQMVEVQFLSLIHRVLPQQLLCTRAGSVIQIPSPTIQRAEAQLTTVRSCLAAQLPALQPHQLLPATHLLAGQQLTAAMLLHSRIHRA
jgi:hypothetical protein